MFISKIKLIQNLQESLDFVFKYQVKDYHSINTKLHNMQKN